jgi:serine/threonine protein kinase
MSNNFFQLTSAVNLQHVTSVTDRKQMVNMPVIIDKTQKVSHLMLNSNIILRKRYKIANKIKSASMGNVYKAIDIKSDNICTIKELIPPYGTPQEEQVIKLFKMEAEMLSKLRHPNLPEVSDYFVSNGRYYLVMNFIEGQDLETKLFIKGNPGLPVSEVVEWTKQILQVLDYLHNQKPPVIYRDIKPSNIILHKDGRVMLIDSGIERVINQESQNYYTPVEQSRDRAEPGSDLYALGATMHHLITGIEPLASRFEPLRKIIPSISANLENIVMKALKYDINERFSSAREMKEELENFGQLLQLIIKKDIDGIKLLISQGADINAKSNDGLAPLHLAVWEKSPDITELLLSQGIDINVKSNDGLTPLHIAVWENLPDIVELLLSRGADINAKCNDGFTPLHIAVWENLPDIVELLISQGADINAKCNDGFTPLHIALEVGRKEVVEILKRKAEIKSVSNNERPGFFGILKGVGNFIIDAGNSIAGRSFVADTSGEVEWNSKGKTFVYKKYEEAINI